MLVFWNDVMKKKYKIKIKNILLLFVVFFILAIAFVFFFYQSTLGIVSDSEALKEVVIDKGSSSKNIAQILKEKHLIQNEYSFLVYIKLHHIKDLKFGTYLLSENMGVSKIVAQLQNGSNYNPDEVTITFQEGLNMREIAKVISQNTNNSYDSVLEKANDSLYIQSLKEKYWFITNDLDNSNLYYKLEGYLFPNTYKLASKDESVEYIFSKMLDETAKHLEKYREYDFEKMSIHSYLTLASMAEKESSIKSDRGKIVCVFLNRMHAGMNLGSDVTARYANRIDDKKTRLSDAQFNFKSPYNTRLLDGSMNGKLPVGPISSVSLESIEAAFAPDEHHYLYFISNIQTQETFFYDSYSDFLIKKEELSGVNQGF